MTTSQEKRGVRFNVIDILIVLIPIVLITAMALRHRAELANASGGDLINVEVEFLIQNMSNDMISSVVNGDTVMTEGGTIMGTIKSSDFQKAAIYYTGEDGIPVLTYSDYSYDVRCVFTAQGTLGEQGFLLNGMTYLAAGQTVKIKTPHLIIDVLITNVTVIE